ncbi:hypothetical protein Bca101_035216 [Brassica carinata]
MEKEIYTRHLSREGTGCVWLFMNMFDLRHGGSNHKLLLDRKRGSKRITGTETKVEKQLTCDCDCEKSVKKLIEEEIDEKTHQKCDTTECRGRTKARNKKMRSRTCSKTNEGINALITGDDDHAEKKPDEQCPRTSQSDADSINDDDSEEKFSELIKRLIAQKESEVESCKSFVDDDSKEESSFLNFGTSPVFGDSHRIKEMSSPNESRTQTIVVLKPEPNCFDLGSSPGRHGKRNKAKNERLSSRFLLGRIRRRLTSAKNPCHAQHDSDPDADAFPSNMSQNSCLEEEIETISSSGRHVSDGEILPEANNEGSKKSMCGIYIAAKKHLSEMLAEGGIDVGSHDKEVPRILGKILALPQFSTPENSPRMTMAHDVVAPQITEKPNIQQSSSEDYYSETLGSHSNDHEETKSDMPVPGAGEISFSIVHQDTYVDEDKFETHDEHNKHTQPLEKETYDEKYSPCSPPSSSVKMPECQDNATDVPGKSSPVSVLEPFFTDDDISPNPSRFSSVEMRLKPLCIRFEEPDSPRPEKTRLEWMIKNWHLHTFKTW